MGRGQKAGCSIRAAGKRQALINPAIGGKTAGALSDTLARSCCPRRRAPRRRSSCWAAATVRMPAQAARASGRVRDTRVRSGAVHVQVRVRPSPFHFRSGDERPARATKRRWSRGRGTASRRPCDARASQANPSEQRGFALVPHLVYAVDASHHPIGDQSPFPPRRRGRRTSSNFDRLHQWQVSNGAVLAKPPDLGAGLYRIPEIMTLWRFPD